MEKAGEDKKKDGEDGGWLEESVPERFAGVKLSACVDVSVVNFIERRLSGRHGHRMGSVSSLLAL